MATMLQILQFLDGNGDPLAGGKVYWYQAGTTVPQDTWVDETESSAAANPVILDSEGHPDHGSGADAIWIRGSYKMVLKDSSDVTIVTLDNINEYDQIDWTGLTATIADLNSTTTTALLKTSDYTVVVGDRGKSIFAAATTGNITINLPAAATAGNKFKILVKKTDNSINSVTIDPSGAETVDTQTTFGLYDFNDFAEIQCDGSNWKIVAARIRGTVRAITAVTTVALDDQTKVINADASGGAYALNLPSAVTVGRGYRITVKKTDSSTNIVTVTASGAETIDGSATFGLHNQYAAASIISDGANWSIYSEFGDAISGGAYPYAHLRGFQIARDVGDVNYDIIVTSGTARGFNDLANMKINLGANLIKRVDATWEQGTNKGGFPSAITFTADTWYHFFVIGRSDGTTDAGFDSDISATNLLAQAGSSWVDYLRVGSVRADATPHITDFTNYILRGGSRVFYWNVPSVDHTGQLTTVALLLTLKVPPDVYTTSILTAYTTCPPATGGYGLKIWPTDVNGAGGVGYCMCGVGAPALGNTDSAGAANVLADINSQVYVAVTSNAGASPSRVAEVVTWGWME